MEKTLSSTSSITGLSPVAFYGTKTTTTKKAVPSKSHYRYKTKSAKKKDGRINKNVSHKIRKPKVSKKKTIVGSKVARLRIKAIRMPSRLATNRSTFKEGKKVKFHKLASPGVSLLEDPDTQQPSPQKKKFFTSRSKEAAVVNISKTIKLSSVNGEISMNSRQGGLPKKNIGRMAEKELNDQISAGILNISITDSVDSDSSHLNASSKGIPEDVTSPRKRIKNSVLTPLKQKISANSVNPLSSKKTDLVTKAKRISPRKHVACRNSPYKENVPLSSPKRRCSPRKLTYNERKFLSPRKLPATNFPRGTTPNFSIDNLAAEWIDDTNEQISFDESLIEDAILSELLSDNHVSIIEKSEGQNAIVVRSPRRTPRKEMKNVKYFPVFQSRSIKIENKMKEKRRNAKRSLGISDDKQMIIDAGQTTYGAIHCKSCDFLYEVGDPSEEKLHNEFHYGLAKALSFYGWKNERLASNVDKHGGRILKIMPKDVASWWRKVSDIVEIVDMDLGFVDRGCMVKERSTAYLYVKKKSISGCVIVEDIDRAFKFIQQVTGLNEGGLLCCSSVPQKAFVGVSRIWVTASERRMGIASALMNAMRSTMYPCHYLTTEEFAFSDPTEHGMNFARKYTNISDFLVYRRSEAFLTNNLK